MITDLGKKTRFFSEGLALSINSKKEMFWAKMTLQYILPLSFLCDSLEEYIFITSMESSMESKAEIKNLEEISGTALSNLSSSK